MDLLTWIRGFTQYALDGDPSPPLGTEKGESSPGYSQGITAHHPIRRSAYAHVIGSLHAGDW